jgi:hypothetical protein
VVVWIQGAGGGHDTVQEGSRWSREAGQSGCWLTKERKSTRPGFRVTSFFYPRVERFLIL